MTKKPPRFVLVALAASASTISPLAGQEGQWHYDDVTNLLDLMMAAVNDEHTSADCKRILTFSAEGLTKARDTRGVHWKWLNPNYAGAVVLVFSGHWCGPCRIEYPYQRFMLELYEGEPVVILGVNSDPALETIQQAKIDEGLDYRTWWDGHGDIPTQGPIATSWKVQGWPTIYVIDEEGVIQNVNKRGGDLISTVDRMLMEMKARDGEIGSAMGVAK